MVTVQSAKAKGRRLQQWVAAQILERFPSLKPDDVSSTPMGTSGVDVRLSTAAQALFPYKVECKARAGIKTIYDWFDQAAKQKGNGAPLLIIKQDRREPLAIVDASYFIERLNND